MNVTQSASDSAFSDFILIRRGIHRHPEIAYQEQRTSALIANKLHEYGYEVFQGIAKTGVVGKLTRPGSQASIALRADMDALPIREANDFAHASACPGTMHACGHDGHIAMLLAASWLLASSSNFTGTLYVIFQPAEEVGEDSGAARMIQEGVFERFPADAVFAMHNHPGLGAGRFMARSGPFMAASDKARIRIHGVGAHAARPHQGVDAALVASSIVVNLQSIVSRNVDPSQAAVISVGRMAAGHTYNVIPGTADLELSIRSFDEDVRQLLRCRIEELVVAQAQAFGARADLEYVSGYPVLINAPDLTSFALDVAREVAGDEAVDSSAPPIMGSEDFAYMLQMKPGCLIRIGNGEDSPTLHHPEYEFNDSNISVGAVFWKRLVERFLESRSR